MSEWQPISTLEEGVDALLFFPDHNDEYQRMIGHLLDGDWYPQDSDANPDPFETKPTYWMEIPAPPEGA